MPSTEVAIECTFASHSKPGHQSFATSGSSLFSLKNPGTPFRVLPSLESPAAMAPVVNGAMNHDENIAASMINSLFSASVELLLLPPPVALLFIVANFSLFSSSLFIKAGLLPLCTRLYSLHSALSSITFFCSNPSLEYFGIWFTFSFGSDFRYNWNDALRASETPAFDVSFTRIGK